MSGNYYFNTIPEVYLLYLNSNLNEFTLHQLFLVLNCIQIILKRF